MDTAETRIGDWPFRAASALTDRFPHSGARILDTLVSAYAANPLMLASTAAAARAALSRAHAFRRILVVADLNIGDAVVLQAALSALRDYLPAAELEYAITVHARDLVDGNPDATAVHPIFTGTGTPGTRDADAVRRLTGARGYDLIFNFCPFFDAAALAPTGTPVVGYAALAAMIVHAARQPAEVAHVAALTHRFIHRLFSPLLRPARERAFTGVSATLSAESADRAAAFVRRARGEAESLVLLNPDASNRFTRLPLEDLAELLRGLLRLPCTVLVGAGHTEPGLEERVIASLRAPERARVRVLPASVPLDVYAAVVDGADVFLTGDTGPLHVAAARKESRSGGTAFRNRTAVISIFGATPERVYGYASDRPGFLAANQGARSATCSAPSPCRNLTCIHKTAKTCRTVRCFDALDLGAVLAEVERALSGGRRRLSAPAAPLP